VVLAVIGLCTFILDAFEITFEVTAGVMTGGRI
jgi:hypothetical protein